MAPVYATRGGAALLMGALLTASCTSNPYFIGSVCEGGACGGGGGAIDESLSFAIDLNRSGLSQLATELVLPGPRTLPTLSFRGESATASDWPSEQGARGLKAVTSPTLDVDTPFTDGTRAVGFSQLSEVYAANDGDLGEVAGDDFAMELVLRAPAPATLVSKRNAGNGWALTTAVNGTLRLDLADDQALVQVASEPLVPGAWYHCLFWISRQAGGRADCNGRPGNATDLSALGDLSSAEPFRVGGPGPGPLGRLAFFALHRVGSGGLGSPSDWTSISQTRFSILTGIRPRVAKGTPVPRAGVRNSAAFVDIQRTADDTRRLFLVGADWPRIACRNDTMGTRVCGYLSEPHRARLVPNVASQWTALGLTVTDDSVDFADGVRGMSALVPSKLLTPHTLLQSGMFGGARQTLSFFARAESGQFVSASVANHGTAVFDVRAGSVVSQPGGARATIEDWGGGVFRCAYLLEPEAGNLTYKIEIVGGAEAEQLTGDGTSPWLDVAEPQLDVGQAYSGSPLGAATQPGDQLSFVADDGNLPSSESITQRFDVLLPVGPRLTDQALLNLNRGGSFDTQVQVYLRGDTNQLKFLGLRDGDTHWAFDNPASLVDGHHHAIEASWGPSYAALSVDGNLLRQSALLANSPAFALDRIEVGYSENSSGSLEGLLGALAIGATPPP